MASGPRLGLMFAAIVAVAAAEACRSSPKEAAPASSSVATSSSSGSGAPEAAARPGAGSSSSGAACSASMVGGAEACEPCCEAAYPSGYRAYERGVLQACACAASSPCRAQCGAGECDGGAPSPACEKCLSEAAGTANACFSKAASGCTGECAAFATCAGGC